VTRWLAREDAIDADEEARLRHALARCFAQRRRTLRNNLRAATGDDEAALALLARAGLDPGLRAEQLPPEAFRRLARLA
jgi:16S rRNA (adenine1518-N6/adenine1519-N6)-dimethyltransferase